MLPSQMRHDSTSSSEPRTLNTLGPVYWQAAVAPEKAAISVLKKAEKDEALEEKRREKEKAKQEKEAERQHARQEREVRGCMCAGRRQAGVTQPLLRQSTICQALHAELHSTSLYMLSKALQLARPHQLPSSCLHWSCCPPVGCE